MSRWLFPDFLNDPEAYAKAQRHWEGIWDKIVPPAEGRSRWRQPWMRNPKRDGNPIFSAVSPSLQRGVRIIQEEPCGPDDLDLDWWVDSFEVPDDPVAVRELVVACCPTKDNVPLVEELLWEWVMSGEETVTSAPCPI